MFWEFRGLGVDFSINLEKSTCLEVYSDLAGANSKVANLEREVERFERYRDGWERERGELLAKVEQSFEERRSLTSAVMRREQSLKVLGEELASCRHDLNTAHEVIAMLRAQLAEQREQREAEELAK